MRISAITNSRIPSLTANSIQVMKVCQTMTELGHHVKILAPNEPRSPATSNLIEHYGLNLPPDIIWLPSIRFLKRLDFIIHAQKAVSISKVDLVYTWLPQSAVLALRMRYPVVLEMHGDVGGRFGAWWLRQFLQTPGQKRMTVTTKALKSALEERTGMLFPNDEVMIAPNGVDPEEYKNLPDPIEARRRLKLDERMTIGFTGHIYPGRGADLMFDLAERIRACNFLWVGGSPETVGYWQNKLATAGLRHVTMTGFVPHDRIALYQAAADILLMPYGKSISASSGQEIAAVINPMKMFEYMAAGRAIISADLPVIREILNEDNAVLCEPGNREQWSKSIQELLADDQRRMQLGVRARGDVGKYTWVARSKRILAVFER